MEKNIANFTASVNEGVNIIGFQVLPVTVVQGNTTVQPLSNESADYYTIHTIEPDNKRTWIADLTSKAASNKLTRILQIIYKAGVTSNSIKGEPFICAAISTAYWKEKTQSKETMINTIKSICNKYTVSPVPYYDIFGLPQPATKG